MKQFHILSILLVLASCAKGYEHPMESELRRVDEVLDEMDEYVALKESRINTIRESLTDTGLTLNQKYSIYGRLFEEYAPYQFDRAREMLEMQEMIADSLSDVSLRTTATLIQDRTRSHTSRWPSRTSVTMSSVRITSSS